MSDYETGYEEGMGDGFEQAKTRITDLEAHIRDLKEGPDGISSLKRKLSIAVGALEHYSTIKDTDGALGRDRREIAREALREIRGEGER